MTSYQEGEGAGDGSLKGFARYTSCLIPVIMAILLLALGITAINYFIDTDSERAPASSDAGADAAASDAASAESSRETEQPGRTGTDQFSTEGILALITGLGWSQFGELAHYELGGRTRQTRKFRKNGAKISLTIHAFKSVKAAKAKSSELGPERRRVRFDHKIVVIEGLNSAGRARVAPLVERLEEYRNMVGE